MRGEKTSRLLQRVAVRQRLAVLGVRLHFYIFLFGGVYLAGLCAGRLLGLAPRSFTWPTLLVVPAAALLAAILFVRRPRETETARLVDQRAKTQDLYLTAVLIDQAIGDFKPLVLASAEARAEQIKPSEVVPFRWQKGARNAAIALAVLAVAVGCMPTLDPFGKEEARRKAAGRARQLEETRKATALRMELLKKEQPDAKVSKEVEQRLAELKNTLDTARPTEQKANLAALQQRQKDLSDLWRKASERKLKDAIERMPPAQQFGALNPKNEEWKQELQKGNAAGLNKELQELQKKAEDLAQMPDGAEKEAARQQLKERMRDVADFLAREANNKQVQEALQRAADQLAMAGNKAMEKQALEAMKNTLKMTEMELNALAQNIRDLQALEQGLNAAQLARRLNDKGKLGGQPAPGDGDGNGDPMAGYAAFYQKLLEEGQLEQEVAGGMGGPGRGEGNIAPEDNAVKSDFKSEHSKSALTAGKILLQMKVHELSEAGEARISYLEKIAEIKQGASEAVLKEQVPPGYHQAISKYFDAIGDGNAKPASP